MKLLIVAIFLVGFALAENLNDEQKERLKTYRKECMTTAGIDHQHWDEWMREGRWKDEAKSRKYWLCLNKRIGFQDEHGKLKKDIIEKKAKWLWGEENSRQIVQNCVKDWATPEEAAFQYAKCAHNYFDHTQH